MSDIFRAKRGSDLSVILAISKGGAALDLSGVTGLRVMAKKSYSQADSNAIIDATTAGGDAGQVVVMNAATGQIKLTATSARMALVTPGQYLLAVQFTHPTDGVIEVPSEEAGYTFTVIHDLITTQ